mmetsp:Transcript_25496/g.60694  ORF Transcript_25496/g.60694 Transcript_25496/m.60694 type:complete len:128 (-) Transcript_25496:799-1182(-)
MQQSPVDAVRCQFLLTPFVVAICMVYRSGSHHGRPARSFVPLSCVRSQIDRLSPKAVFLARRASSSYEDPKGCNLSIRCPFILKGNEFAFAAGFDSDLSRLWNKLSYGLSHSGINGRVVHLVTKVEC